MDSVGSRYGLLPSEVLVRATTFDLHVLDIAICYENYRMSKAKGEAPTIRQEDLMQALDKVRKEQ